jgi:hypothetical protein
MQGAPERRRALRTWWYIDGLRHYGVPGPGKRSLDLLGPRGVGGTGCRGVFLRQVDFVIDVGRRQWGLHTDLAGRETGPIADRRNRDLVSAAEFG